MNMREARVSVLVPVYNEEKTAPTVVERVLALGDLVKEIIVVDDGSTDGTARVLDDLATRERRVRFIRLERNQGKTAAIRRARLRQPVRSSSSRTPTWNTTRPRFRRWLGRSCTTTPTSSTAAGSWCVRRRGSSTFTTTWLTARSPSSATSSRIGT